MSRRRIGGSSGRARSGPMNRHGRSRDAVSRSGHARPGVDRRRRAAGRGLARRGGQHAAGAAVHAELDERGTDHDERRLVRRSRGGRAILGQGITTATGIDPQTVLTSRRSANDVDVIANQANTGHLHDGGVAEFDIADPVVALAGLRHCRRAATSLLHLNTTGPAEHHRRLQPARHRRHRPTTQCSRSHCSTASAASGNFTNLPAGFVADATTGPSLATLVTPVSVQLPAAAENQPLVQVRVITTNAVGNDEWVGVDDISIQAAVDTRAGRPDHDAGERGDGRRGRRRPHGHLQRAGDHHRLVVHDHVRHVGRRTPPSTAAARRPSRSARTSTSPRARAAP